MILGWHCTATTKNNNENSLVRHCLRLRKKRKQPVHAGVLRHILNFSQNYLQRLFHWPEPKGKFMGFQVDKKLVPDCN